MKSKATTAHSANSPKNLPLPIEPPRDAWAGLIDHAASALVGTCIYDSEALALELRAIATAFRAEVQA